MKKRIIETFPYPLNQIINNVIDYIVVYFNKSGEIIDYNQMFKEVFKIKDDDLEKLNIKELVSFENLDFFNLKFDCKESKRLLIELNKKYSKNPINNSYDSYIYKVDEIYFLIGKKDFHDSERIINDMTLLTNQLSNLSRDINKKNRALTKANERIEKLLRHDKLTGLSNRRHFIEYIQKAIAIAHRHNDPLTLVMCDLDHFKDINDTFGHAVGDLVLKAVGSVLGNKTRTGELAARVGGDEFAIILTQTSLEKAEIFTERIRKSISEINLNEISKPITISIGLTDLKPDETLDAFFKRADMAMYKAKKQGKNRVCTPD